VCRRAGRWSWGRRRRASWAGKKQAGCTAASGRARALEKGQSREEGGRFHFIDDQGERWDMEGDDHQWPWTEEIKVDGSVGRNCPRIMGGERKRARLFTAAREEAIWRDAARRRAGAALDERHEAVLCELGSWMVERNRTVQHGPRASDLREMRVQSHLREMRVHEKLAEACTLD
jgi:hypothetical protein